jgi:hypothetical protein
MQQDWQDFAQFMDIVQKTAQNLELREHQDVFYRGHTKTSYSLLPSIFRQQNCKTEEDFWKLERRTFFQFRALARELYGGAHLDWDVLFHMQHHGVPTRLLDWTSVFGVALYFALLGSGGSGSDSVPCVWLLNPYGLNKAVWNTHNLFHPKYLARDERNNRSYDYGELLLHAHMGDQSQAVTKGWKKLPWEKPLAIYDNQRSGRMFSQSGWFTIHGTDIRPLEVIFADRPDILQKVEIPAAAIPAAQQFLTLAGIGHRQLFPDLDGLAKSVKERFGLTR